jgi:putative flavoprotein involved in K+ transport
MERIDTLVIGGGQAGLATGYWLAKRGERFMILDANERVGDAWRLRWDSLRLFTPARFDGLPGMRFPAPPWTFPTKDEMADYLEAYAERFALPVRTGVRVTRLGAIEGGFEIRTEDDRFEAARVIVATGAYRWPKTPPFAFDLDPDVVQLHASDYRRPAQLRDGPALVVGVGNSGAEIAFELAASRRTILSGVESGQIPVRHGPATARTIFRVIRFLGTRVITRSTPLGRKIGTTMASRPAPLIRTRGKELAAAGVERVGRVVGVRDGMPELDDGTVLDVPNVIWCTGYQQTFPWIDLPIFDERGAPEHELGLVPSQPGLAFVGLVFQHRLASDVLPGVGLDARYVVDHLARSREPTGRLGGWTPATSPT